MRPGGEAGSPPTSGRYRHAISLLVHERIDVIVDQCLNFTTFAPRSAIMVHVSESATFVKPELEAALAAAGCDHAIVNPVSLPTRWGDIIGAHLANIRALEAVCDPSAHVALHASNDMLLRALPDDEGAAGARFELREVSATSIWYTGRQFGRSRAFAELIDRLGCPRPVGSQIEGSSYPLAVLLTLDERIAPLRALVADLPGVAEEVVFPTWAYERLGAPLLRPFILFRASRTTGLGARLLPRALRGGSLPDLGQKGLNRLQNKLGASPDANPADTDAIIAGHPLPATAWPNGWSRQAPMIYHGIKRIARAYDDPSRVRIRAHTQAVRAARGGQA